MPELPEVETIRRDLDKEGVTRRIKSVEVKGKRSIRRHKSGPEFRNRLEGKRVASVRRAGKYLLLGLDGDDVLVVHLGMSGQLRLVEPDAPLAKHTHVILELDDGRQLRYRDPRRFGHDLEFPPADRIRVYDDTLRDGEQMPGVAFSPADKYELARALSEIGVHIMDVGFPAVGGSERETLKRVLEGKRRGELRADLEVLCMMRSNQYITRANSPSTKMLRPNKKPIRFPTVL